MKTFELNNFDGSTRDLPLISFGTFRLKNDECYEAVICALRAGYRRIDTAAVYRNEEEVGRAVRDSNIPREEVFVTTKLHPRNTKSREDVIEAARASNERLGLGYVDLLLLHWPAVSGVKSESDQQAEYRLVSWGAMRSLAAGEVEGVDCRAIGVSNYLEKHLEGLMKCNWNADCVNMNGSSSNVENNLGRAATAGVQQDESTKREEISLQNESVAELVKEKQQQQQQQQQAAISISTILSNQISFSSHGISLNQVEMHPLLDNTELLDLCTRAGIVLEGYAPLGEGHSDLLAHPTVVRISNDLGKDPAWVLLSWAAQRDRPVVVKSGQPDRIVNNLVVMQCGVPADDVDDVGAGIGADFDTDFADTDTTVAGGGGVDNVADGDVAGGGIAVNAADYAASGRVLLSSDHLVELSQLCSTDLKFCWDPRRVA